MKITALIGLFVLTWVALTGFWHLGHRAGEREGWRKAKMNQIIHSGNIFTNQPVEIIQLTMPVEVRVVNVLKDGTNSTMTLEWTRK
jgi:hypothetical protein